MESEYLPYRSKYPVGQMVLAYLGLGLLWLTLLMNLHGELLMEGILFHLLGGIVFYRIIRKYLKEQDRLTGLLEKEKTRLETILRQAPSGVMIAEVPSGKLILENTRSKQILGRKDPGLDSIEKYSDNYHGYHSNGTIYRSEEWPLARTILWGETIVGEEVDMVKADGSRCVISINSVPIYDKDGKRIAGLIQFSDITRHKQAETELKENRELLFQVLNNVPIILFALDQKGVLKVSEGKGLEKIKLRPGQLVGISLFDFYKNEPAIIKSVNRALAGEDFSSIITFKAGAIFDVRWHPMRDRNGQVYAVNGVALDITEKAKMEVERERILAWERENRITAQRSIQMRDDFLSIASHELRTPITPLKMYLQIIKRRIQSVEPAALPNVHTLLKAIDRTEHQLDHFDKLIESLLDVTRISADRLELERRDFDLSQLLKDTITRLKDSLKEAYCRLDVEIEENIWGNFDQLRIEQVITSVLGNAIKFGAGKPIHVLLTRGEASAKLVIKDQGVGILKALQPKVFDRFERVASVRHFGGLGLGLYISRNIVIAHGGTIRVESEVGQGATFIIELPLKKPQEMDMTSKAA